MSLVEKQYKNEHISFKQLFLKFIPAKGLGESGSIWDTGYVGQRIFLYVALNKINILWNYSVELFKVHQLQNVYLQANIKKNTLSNLAPLSPIGLLAEAVKAFRDESIIPTSLPLGIF